MTHVDVGLMQMYCNYVKENWTLPDENPLIGLVLCADKGHALARCALEELPSKIMAANDRTVLPDAELPQTGWGRRDTCSKAVPLIYDEPVFTSWSSSRGMSAASAPTRQQASGQRPFRGHSALMDSSERPMEPTETVTYQARRSLRTQGTVSCEPMLHRL